MTFLILPSHCKSMSFFVRTDITVAEVELRCLCQALFTAKGSLKLNLKDSLTETLWVHLRPRRLPRSVSRILIGVVYHPPDATTSDNDILYNHIQQTVDEYSLKHPDCLIYGFPVISTLLPPASQQQSSNACVA